MRGCARSMIAVLGIVVFAGAARTAEKPVPLAGWYGVFPVLGGYSLTFSEPKFGKDRKTEYEQSAKYEWTGGAFKVVTVTTAHDPAFKKAHDPDALKKQGYREVKVGKKTAWLLGTDKEGIDAVRKLVLPLGEARALLLEAKGMVSDVVVIRLAEGFDADRIATALKAPPRSDFRRSVEAFRAIKKGATLHDLDVWVGHADGADKSNHIWEYKLPDGSRVLVETREFRDVLAVKHEKDGKTEDLVK